MNFPGENSLRLNSDAVMTAIEGALNAARGDGPYIRVTGISQPYSYGPWQVDITTDPAEPPPVAVAPSPKAIEHSTVESAS